MANMTNISIGSGESAVSIEQNVKQDGFTGFYHRGTGGGKKAVIVLGGSDGTDLVPNDVSALFSRQGISALGVCYWNKPGLPPELAKVPVEYVEAAVRWLKGRGYEKIAVYGISKGAEYALVAATLLPDITGVIALSPSHCVYAGLGANARGKKDMLGVSSFTWRGRELPFVRGKMEMGGVLWRLVTQQQLNMSFFHEKALAGLTEDAVIKVEDINGPILLLSPEMDAQWPSKYSCEQIVKRLQESGFPYPVEHVSYRFASHVLAPVEDRQFLSKLRIYKVERRYPDKCGESRSAAFQKSCEWLRAW